MQYNPTDFKLENTSVWGFKERGNWATHKGDYRGNCPPQVPRNLILKYTKENDIPVAQLYLAPPLSTNDIKGLEELSVKLNFFYNAISDKTKINKKNRNSLIEISLEERQKEM